MTTVMRFIRLVRGESLDAIGSKLGFQKSTLSTCERFPDAAGPKLRKALALHYGANWKLIASPITGADLSAALLKTLMKKETHHAN